VIVPFVLVLFVWLWFVVTSREHNAIRKSSHRPEMSGTSQGEARRNQEESRGTSKSQQQHLDLSFKFFYQDHPGFVPGIVENLRPGRRLGAETQSLLEAILASWRL